LLGVVGRATASTPTGPWTVDGEPVLKPGGFGEWDTGEVGNVDVLRYEDGYVMYYAGSKGIGMATSPDGVEWTKYDNPETCTPPFAESDPVIAMPAPAGQHDPNVVRTVQSWQMINRSERGLEYSTSMDGITWTPVAQKPLVSSVDLGKMVWYSAFIVRDQSAYLYFEAGSSKTSIYLATWAE